MDDRAVLRMPVKRFWLYSKNVDRLAAERDLRLLQVMAAVQSPEAFTKTQDRLNKQVGEIVKFNQAARAQEEGPDRAGLAELKAMMG